MKIGTQDDIIFPMPAILCSGQGGYVRGDGQTGADCRCRYSHQYLSVHTDANGPIYNRSLGDVRRIPVTAHPLSGDRERAMAAGCSNFATKSVELNYLVARIESSITGDVSYGR